MAGERLEDQKDQGRHPQPRGSSERDLHEKGTIRNATQDQNDPSKKGMLINKNPDQDLPAGVKAHRVVEACMQVCWACDDYGQTVIYPSSIGCCARPKFPTHAEHICLACIDEINNQTGGED